MFSLPAAAPDRSDCVDDVTSGEPVPRCHLGVASIATAELSARFKKLRPGGLMDCAVDAATAEQRWIRSINNCVYGEGRNVCADDSHFDHARAPISYQQVNDSCYTRVWRETATPARTKLNLPIAPLNGAPWQRRLDGPAKAVISARAIKAMTHPTSFFANSSALAG